MTYLAAGCGLVRMCSVIAARSSSGSSTMSTAHTTPARFGLWSEALAAWLASPMVQIVAFGEMARISSLSTSRLRASRQAMPAPPGDLRWSAADVVHVQVGGLSGHRVVRHVARAGLADQGRHERLVPARRSGVLDLSVP